MMSLSRTMYRATRTVRTIEQVSKGRAPNRARNIAVGRAAAKGGLFRLLFGKRQ